MSKDPYLEYIRERESVRYVNGRPLIDIRPERVKAKERRQLNSESQDMRRSPYDEPLTGGEE